MTKKQMEKIKIKKRRRMSDELIISIRMSIFKMLKSKIEKKRYEEEDLSFDALYNS